MAESSMRFLSPLKLYVFHRRLRRQVALWIWQIPHHESEVGKKMGKRLKNNLNLVSEFPGSALVEQAKKPHAFVIAHSLTTK